MKTFPTRRIKPIDGMAVTAQVWEEAHQYHYKSQGLHSLFSHGAGIVAGLEVLASDPPDHSVYIRPGIAVDTMGQAIVLPQPVAYDFGDELEGFLHLLLFYSEGRPRADGDNQQPDAPFYVRDEFAIVARPAMPDTPVVELARVTREARTSALHDAVDPAHPGLNEIDLRFRRQVGPPLWKTVTIAVCYLGEVANKVHGQGAGYMARALKHLGGYHVVVDDNVPLAPGILAYTLVYLVGEGTFELSSSQIRGLKGYVQRGGTLLLESCDADAASTFADHLKDMEIELQALASGHVLLREPFHFAAPPPGFETEGEVSVSGGVVLSARNYGRLWYGERRDGVPSREEIRTAMEWGANLVAFALR